MDFKKIHIPSTPIMEESDGVFVLPDPEPVETVEVFPGHTIVMSREQRDEKERAFVTYERIVSTKAFPETDTTLEEFEVVESKPGLLRGFLGLK